MTYNLKNVLIFGAGRSGLSVARLVQREGGSAHLIDERDAPTVRDALAACGCTFDILPKTTLPEGDFTLIVTSPSFALDHPWIVFAQQCRAPLISELELGATFWRGETIALTGSKGKSSVVKCLAETLTRAGRPAVTAGNYGIPLCERVMTCAESGAGTIAVTEVSSFQMEHTPTFAPQHAAILNLQADHLDRHGDLETYARLKFRLLTHAQTIYLPTTLAESPYLTAATATTFGCDAAAQWRYHDGSVLGPSQAIPLSGYFNNPVLGQGAALICALLTAYGLTPPEITAGFEAFQSLPHRMQDVATHNGIRYINDSKATSLAATQAALTMVGGNVRLIAGGLLKEREVSFLADTLRETVRAVYLIGASQETLYDAWHTLVPCFKCETLARAVQSATQEAASGDTILLSPGTASFDQYPGMAARGEDFIRCVRAVITP